MTQTESLKDPAAPPLKFPKKHKMFHFHLIEEKNSQHPPWEKTQFNVWVDSSFF